MPGLPLAESDPLVVLMVLTRTTVFDKKKRSRVEVEQCLSPFNVPYKLTDRGNYFFSPCTDLGLLFLFSNQTLTVSVLRKQSKANVEQRGGSSGHHRCLKSNLESVKIAGLNVVITIVHVPFGPHSQNLVATAVFGSMSSMTWPRHLSKNLCVLDSSDSIFSCVV